MRYEHRFCFLKPHIPWRADFALMVDTPI